MKTHCRIWVTDDKGNIEEDSLKTVDHNECELNNLDPTARAVFLAIAAHSQGGKQYYSIVSRIVRHESGAIPERGGCFEPWYSAVRVMCDAADEAIAVEKEVLEILTSVGSGSPRSASPPAP